MENVDTEDTVETLRDVLTQQERERRRLANKPFIDHLEDAIVVKDGKPTLIQGKGMRVIIERTASMLIGRPWLDTRSYIIQSVNPETGEMRLWDEELQHHASSNFITAPELGYRFKIPARKGAPLPRRNKAEPKPKAEEKPTASSTKVTEKETERRIYATRGVIHTRNKGIAYAPQGETKAKDGMRLMTTLVGFNLRVRNVDDGWTETWSVKSDL